MLIENKWVVLDTRTKLYYAGNDKNGLPTPQPLSANTRKYKTKRAANCAIDRISEISEYYSFTAVYIESQEVPENEIEAITSKLAEISDTRDWQEVYCFAVPGTDKFSKIRLCIKVVNGIELFGIKKKTVKYTVQALAAEKKL